MTHNDGADWPRLFYLYRVNDVSGVSGTGRVADGVLWPDGTATLRWRGPDRSVAFYDDLDSVERIHGHDGSTVALFHAPVNSVNS